VLYVFINLVISTTVVISKLMSTTMPENGGDRRSLMRPPSIAFDHFRYFSFPCLVRVRRRRSRHTSRGAHRRPSLVRARGREPPKWVHLPLLFQLMALLRAIVHGSSSVPPLHPPPPPSPSPRRELEGEEVSVVVEVGVEILCILQFMFTRGSGRRENTEQRVLCPPSPSFRTPLRELVERLQCRSTPLSLLLGSFTGPVGDSLIAPFGR
jgi:hypothetical protein